MDAFLDAWHQAEAARRAYIASLEPWVHTWIGVMTWAIRASLLFVVWRWEARWVLLVGILTPISANLLRIAMGTAYPPGTNHVLLWTPLVVYLAIRCVAFWRTEFRRAEQEPADAIGLRRVYWAVRGHRLFKLLFGVWLTAILGIMLASLVFDYRTVIAALIAAGAP